MGNSSLAGRWRAMCVASPVSQHSHSLGHSLDSNTHTRLDLHSVYADTWYVKCSMPSGRSAEAHTKKKWDRAILIVHLPPAEDYTIFLVSFFPPICDTSLLSFLAIDCCKNQEYLKSPNQTSFCQSVTLKLGWAIHFDCELTLRQCVERLDRLQNAIGTLCNN